MATETKKPQTFRLEVNEPVIVRFDENGRRMRLTLLDVSAGGCRLQSTACIPHEKLAFEWTGPSQKPIELRGTIVEAGISKRKEPSYGIAFDMPVVERDRLAAELAEIQRRAAYKPPDAVGDGGKTKRQAYRAAIKFNVTVHVPGRANAFPGEANDLSIGGLLLNTTENIEEGSVVEIRFTLPLDDVELGGEQKEVAERTPFGQRLVKKTVPIRPFEPFAVKLKIVKRVGSTPIGYSFGTAFHDMQPFAKEEIARFVHAYQLTQLRRAAALEK